MFLHPRDSKILIACKFRLSKRQKAFDKGCHGNCGTTEMHHFRHASLSARNRCCPLEKLPLTEDTKNNTKYGENVRKIAQRDQ